jgi:hypothetical protein
MPDWVHTLGFDKKHWKNWFLQQPVDPNEESEHGDYQKIEGFQIFADPYKSIKYLEEKAPKIRNGLPVAWQDPLQVAC